MTYLRTFKFEGDIWSVPEGTPFFPGEPVLTVRAKAIADLICVHDEVLDTSRPLDGDLEAQAADRL